MTKSNRDRVIEVDGEVEENQVKSWPIEDNGHDLLKFRLSTCVHEVECCCFLNVLDGV